MFSKNFWIININIGTKCQIATPITNYFFGLPKKEILASNLCRYVNTTFFYITTQFQLKNVITCMCLSLLQCAIQYKKFIGFYLELTIQMYTCYSYLNNHSNVLCLFHVLYLDIHGLTKDFVASVGLIHEILDQANRSGEIRKSIQAQSQKIRM